MPPVQVADEAGVDDEAGTTADSSTPTFDLPVRSCLPMQAISDSGTEATLVTRQTVRVTHQTIDGGVSALTQ